MILEEIFDGTFCPAELCMKDSEEFSQAHKNAERLMALLSMRLCEEDYALVNDLNDELLRARAAECKLNFQYGFASGLLLMREAQDFVKVHMKP